MDDDLDAFFDDVENAVKEVQEEEVASKNKTNESEPSTSSLDAKDSTQQQQQRAEDEEPPEEQRPVKRIKVVAASSGAVKNIVASSVPIVSIAPPPPPASAAGTAAPSIAVAAQPPPPPPPPHPNNNNHHNINSQYYAADNTIAAQTTTNDTTKKSHVRAAAGQTWTDPTLTQWPPNDFRLFVGNLAKDLKDHDLSAAFSKYPSFAMAKIMYNKSDGKSRGYGFVSVLDPKDCAKAIREMNQSWLGSRPIQVKRSEWKDREWKEVQKKKRKDGRSKKHFGM